MHACTVNIGCAIQPYYTIDVTLTPQLVMQFLGQVGFALNGVPIYNEANADISDA